jgi:hypothetical protein
MRLTKSFYHLKFSNVFYLQRVGTRSASGCRPPDEANHYHYQYQSSIVKKTLEPGACFNPLAADR